MIELCPTFSNPNKARGNYEIFLEYQIQYENHRLGFPNRIFIMCGFNSPVVVLESRL